MRMGGSVADAGRARKAGSPRLPRVVREVRAVHVVLGSALLFLGAAGATTVTRALEERRQALLAVPANVPMGLLIGAGAALVRGWDLTGSMITGAVLVPVVGALAGLRRGRGPRRERGGGT
jgi:hypothetical protein